MRNNKGFSLVELIIVIAIMAILVGVMAPQLIKYIEKSNVSADTQLCDSIHTAIITAMMDPEVVTDSNSATQAAVAQFEGGTGVALTGVIGASDKFTQAVRDILGIDSAADIVLKSHNSSGLVPASNIMVSTDRNRCYVWITASDATGSKDESNGTVISVY